MHALVVRRRFRRDNGEIVVRNLNPCCEFLYILVTSNVSIESHGLTYFEVTYFINYFDNFHNKHINGYKKTLTF